MAMPPTAVNGPVDFARDFSSSADRGLSSGVSGVDWSTGVSSCDVSQHDVFLVEQHDPPVAFDVGATAGAAGDFAFPNWQHGDGSPACAQQQRPLVRSASLQPHTETAPAVHVTSDAGNPSAVAPWPKNAKRTPQNRNQRWVNANSDGGRDAIVLQARRGNVRLMFFSFAAGIHVDILIRSLPSLPPEFRSSNPPRSCS
jgi:hypothetical protein